MIDKPKKEEQTATLPMATPPVHLPLAPMKKGQKAPESRRTTRLSAGRVNSLV